MNDDFLKRKLQQRSEAGALRQLRLPAGGVDFCSNDYLGIVHHGLISIPAGTKHGSTGSRLLSGNCAAAEALENRIAAFHEAETGLLFNSGYDANIGLMGTLPQRGDTVLYDNLSHASLRDGIRLSNAHAYAFRHNDMADLEKKIDTAAGNIFVVTESVFSMDGDLAPLRQLADCCSRYNALLIVDEAHATGVIGDKGEGLVQRERLQHRCLARVHTFGKAVGCHGAIVLGSNTLREYLVNFSRPLIYTTAMPPAAVEAIANGYTLFPGFDKERAHLQRLTEAFRHEAQGLPTCPSDTPIQGIIIPGNEAVKAAAAHLQKNGFDVRPILSPTVPRHEERLRIVLHAFNTEGQVSRLVAALRMFSGELA